MKDPPGPAMKDHPGLERKDPSCPAMKDPSGPAMKDHPGLERKDPSGPAMKDPPGPVMKDHSLLLVAGGVGVNPLYSIWLHARLVGSRAGHLGYFLNLFH